MKANKGFKQGLTGGLAMAAAVLSLSLGASAEKKEFKYTAAAGTTVSIVNQRGTVTVKPASGRQVLITATPSTDKVEVDGNQTGNRVTVRTHTLGKASGDDLKVDYEIQLPADASISIDSGIGDVQVENVRGNVTIDSEEGQIGVRGVSGAIIQVQNVSGSVNLEKLQKARVQVTSTGGNITLRDVSGPDVTANSTTGNIGFTGDFGGAGRYQLTNHSGDIEVTMPASASVDLTARSMRGSVQNDFPLQKAAHSAFQAQDGKSLAGTSNSAASSVELRSFSGKIRVKKQ